MHWPGSETEPFNRFRLERLLTTRVFGRQLVTLPRTTSTNDLAKELALQGAPEGTVIVADEQTAGRGRMERRWLAPPGTCLLCSILFRPALSLPQVNWLTMLCSMAAADAVEKTSVLQVTLKWPNDLIIQSSISPPTSSSWSKLAGVLTETGITGQRLDFAVVGMGINVNVERDVLPALAPNATSILAESGRRVDRAVLLATILTGVEDRYTRLQAGESPHAEWASRLVTLGRHVEASVSGETLSGVAEAVDEDGALLLRLADGTQRRLMAADVTLAQM